MSGPVQTITLKFWVPDRVSREKLVADMRKFMDMDNSFWDIAQITDGETGELLYRSSSATSEGNWLP